MGNAQVDTGLMRKLATSWRLWGRYLRLKQKARRQRRTLDRIGTVHAAEIRYRKEKSDREIARLQQTILQYQTKVEIIQRESADRVMEALKLVGTGYAIRETDERIRDLRFETFEQKKREDNYPFSLRHTLAVDDQSRYDAAFESHRQRGIVQGHDEATIQRIWHEHEEKVLEDLHQGY